MKSTTWTGDERRTVRAKVEVQRMTGRGKPDARALARELAAHVRGEVRFDDGSRALYSTDASNYRQVPIGVVIPRGVEDVVRAIEICRRFGAPVLARGGGTSLAGQCCNVAVVLDLSKSMNRILELDAAGRWARVQPGVVLDDLRHRAEHFHLTFAPDPSTHNHCTFGGMIGNDSCGVHSVMGGRTSDNVEWLDILTYDGLRLRVGPTSEQELAEHIAAGGRRGQIYERLAMLRDRCADLIRARFPKLARRVSGYSLEQLLPENGFNVARALVGSEGTCVTVLEAKVRLVDSPQVRSLLVLGYPDIYSAGDHIREVLEGKPIGLEGLDDVLVEHMRRKRIHPGGEKNLPPGKGWLLVEFGGATKEEADAQARRLMERLARGPGAPSMKLYDDPALEERLWKVRESGLGATARVPGERDTWEGWEDSAVPPEHLGEYLRQLRALLDRYGYGCALYGHFGQGCVHTRIDFDLESKEGIATYRSFVEEAADLVVKLGGSLSGEHGDGQSRAELLPRMFGPELVQAFREFKAIWDPQNKMNPGKVVDAYRLDENLRLGAGFEPASPRTHFHFPEDKGSFGYATLRCVGIGECRRDQGGTMCPSYRVTREEAHSTRGRAHLLFEMLQGGAVKGGWRDEHVKEALDLCLACKGCKSDCPMNVDMATYKAEFLSHYYEGRLRPLTAYAVGLIHRWARLGSHAPALVNFLARSPRLSAAGKRLIGVAPERELPAFAPRTFKRRIARRPRPNPEGPKVLLWADTFNNHFHPDTAMAALEALEALGFDVTVPRQPLCCGRPLYDYGMLLTAKRLLRRILDALKAEIRAGWPMVVLEPSCAAVFRDELVSLFPDDDDAQRLSRQTFVLAEFLEKHAAHLALPTLAREAIVQGHCHQSAVMKLDSERRVLEKLGLEVQVLDSGCCGMAGSFGYEGGTHYDVSIKVGERVLLPAVREASRTALIVADGFSCRSQIAHGTSRKALHLSEVLRLAMRYGPSGPAATPPELAVEPPSQPGLLRVKAVAMLGGLLAAVGGLAWLRRRAARRRS
jgi:FAD/FMN-containing dehydrogenase/Fe-S oxidoreductase